MIKIEEMQQKILPSFTAERMLLAFCVMYFNSFDEVEKFYSELAKKIVSEVPISKDRSISDNMKKLHVVYGNLAEYLPKTCYDTTTNLLTTGQAHYIIEDGDQLKINHVTFPDCVETSTRIVLNFLTYNARAKKFILAAEENDENNDYIKKLTEAINKKDTVKSKSKQDLLRLFYLYQSPERVNDSSTTARTFFNSVIFGMNDSKDGLYSLHYNAKKNHLTSGLVNALKTYWNIAYLAAGENVAKKQVCMEVKEKVNNVIKQLGDRKTPEEVRLDMEDAFGAVFSLLNSEYHVSVHIDNLRLEARSFGKEVLNDYYGKIYIEVKDLNDTQLFNFSLVHFNGHSEALYKKERKKLVLAEEEKACLSNEDVKILYDEINSDSQDSQLEIFHAVFFSDNLSLQSSSDVLNLYNQGNLLVPDAVYKLFEKDKDILNHVEGLKVIRKNVDGTIVEKTFKDMLEPLKKVYDTIINGTIVKDWDALDINLACEFCEDKTLISEAIEKLPFEDFKSFLGKFRMDYISSLQVFKLKKGDDVVRLTPFEYAVMRRDWEKAEFIANKVGHSLSFFTFISSDETGGELTALGCLIKNKEVHDILKNSRDKFFLGERAYKDAEKEYNGYEYIKKLGDEDLKTFFCCDAVEKALKDGGEFKTDEIKKLSIREIFAIDSMAKTLSSKAIIASAIEKLNDEEFENFLNELNPKLSKSELIKDSVYREGENFFNAFEYAVKLRKLKKAEILIDMMGDLQYTSLKYLDGSDVWSVWGMLLKDKEAYDLLSKIKDKIDLFSDAYLDGDGRVYNCYEYIEKLDDEKLKEIFSCNLIKKIVNGEDVTLDELKKLNPKVIFTVRGGNTKDKAVMASIIEKFGDEDFVKFLDGLDKNNSGLWRLLSDNKIFIEPEIEGFFYEYNSFEYAIKIEQIGKAVEILKHIDGQVSCQSLCKIKNKSGQRLYCSALSILLEEHVDIVKAYKDKFDFKSYDLIYVDEHRKCYDAREYITDVLHDQALADELCS